MPFCKALIAASDILEYVVDPKKAKTTGKTNVVAVCFNAVDAERPIGQSACGIMPWLVQIIKSPP